MSRHEDPKLTSQASWFENKRRHRHHRHRHSRHKKRLRGLVKFIMPTIVVILAIATGWAVLKVFFFDKRANRKPVARAAAPAAPAPAPTTTNAGGPNKTFAAMEAEMFSYQSAIVATRAASMSKPATASVNDPILDPSEAVRSYSNRMRADVKAAMEDAVVAASRAAARTSASGVLELDAAAVIQKLAQRPLVSPSAPIVSTNVEAALEQATRPRTASVQTQPIDLEKASASYTSGSATPAPSQRDKAAEASAKYSAASQKYQRGNLAGAEADCREVLTDAPDMHPAHNLLGEILSRNQKWEPAIAEFEKAIQGDPENSQYHNNLGLVLSQLNKNERAEEHLVKAYKLDPLSPTVLMNCAWHYRKLKQYPEALKYIEMVLVVSPKHAQARNKRVQTLLDMASYDRAEQLIQEEIAESPRSVQPRMMMALLMVKRGNVDGAIECLRKAESFTTRDQLRMVLERVHDFDAIKDTPQFREYLASLKAQ